MTSELDPLLALAQRVAHEADALGIRTAIIGAVALAHYGFIRGTADVDLAACVDFDTKLRTLAHRLRELGLHVSLHEPDTDDPLAGVLDVRESDESEPVQIINFPGPTGNPGFVAVQRAETVEGGFKVVRLPELIALKLYAGSRFDLDDVERLIEHNPSVDMEQIRSVCREVGLEEKLESVLHRAPG